MYSQLIYIILIFYTYTHGGIQNDAGVNRTTQDGFTPPNASNQIFTSFMKAGIFCEREAPSLMNAEFLGAQDFRYDEICKLTEIYRVLLKIFWVVSDKKIW